MNQPSETCLLKESVTQEVSFIPGLGCSTQSMHKIDCFDQVKGIL